MPDRFSSQRPHWISSLVFLVLGAAVGAISYRVWDLHHQSATTATPSSMHRAGQNDLTDPLLDCETETKSDDTSFAPLESEIQQTIDKETSANNASHVSVYFRSMNGGRWVGINENDQYIGASLIKLPVALAYYKLIGNGVGTLQDKITDNIDQPIASQNIPPAQTIVKGESYTVDDLITRMLKYSDNASMSVLASNISDADIDSVFTDLGITPQRDDQNNSLISPKNYSDFFRVLYNATYFSKQASENLLKIMSQADFKDGLVAGVPDGTTVAHKFGERTETDQNGVVTDTELHDCGIVYYPKHPYFLCVMSKGQSETALEGVISDISKTTYGFVDEYWKKNGTSATAATSTASK